MALFFLPVAVFQLQNSIIELHFSWQGQRQGHLTHWLRGRPDAAFANEDVHVAPYPQWEAGQAENLDQL